MFTEALLAKAKRFLDDCQDRKLKVATAESCTGGLIAAVLTELPGSSSIFDYGFVTYANCAKTASIGVNAQLIDRHGAVSAEVAHAMAEGARKIARADIAVGVTGIAGPGGETEGKPVGLVYVAVATASGTRVTENRFKGDRTAVRAASVGMAYDMLNEALQADFAQVA